MISDLSRARIIGGIKETRRGGVGEKTEPIGGLTVQKVLQSVPVDMSLQCDGFMEAWAEWIEQRLECGKRCKWATTIRCFDRSMTKCRQWGVARSIAAIDHSIEMGYRGLFEPRTFNTNHNPVVAKKNGTAFRPGSTPQYL